MLIAVADNGSSKTCSTSDEDLSNEVNVEPQYISRKVGVNTESN